MADHKKDWWPPQTSGEYAGITCGLDKLVRILVVNLEMKRPTLFFSITIG